MATIRVLSLVASTDSSVATDRALRLHEQLSATGFEVRTLAVAPGNTAGGHETTLPVIAPSRRSIAAQTQIYQESRWADAIVISDPELVSALRYMSWRAELPVVVIGDKTETEQMLKGPKWWNKTLLSTLRFVAPGVIDRVRPEQWNVLFAAVPNPR